MTSGAGLDNALLRHTSGHGDAANSSHYTVFIIRGHPSIDLDPAFFLPNTCILGAHRHAWIASFGQDTTEGKELKFFFCFGNMDHWGVLFFLTLSLSNIIICVDHISDIMALAESIARAFMHYLTLPIPVSHDDSQISSGALSVCPTAITCVSLYCI